MKKKIRVDIKRELEDKLMIDKDGGERRKKKKKQEDEEEAMVDMEEEIMVDI